MKSRQYPTYTFLLLVVLLLLTGCTRSDEEIRSLVQKEFPQRSSRLHITDAQTIGPYSPAVQVGNFLFVSGQIPLDPETQNIAGSDIETQTRQVLMNLNGILRKAGFDSSHVVQCTVYLKDIKDFQRMNLVYGGYFAEGAYPARVTVEVSNLPRNAMIEIGAVAYKGE